MTISSRNTRRTFVVYNTKAPVDTYYNGRHQINVADPIADDEVVNKSYFETNSCTAGDIKMSAMSQDHRKSGGMWLLCNGRTLNKTDYPALYQVIGGSFGSTTTTFNLPNCAGRVLGTASTQNQLVMLLDLNYILLLLKSFQVMIIAGKLILVDLIIMVDQLVAQEHTYTLATQVLEDMVTQVFVYQMEQTLLLKQMDLLMNLMFGETRLHSLSIQQARIHIQFQAIQVIVMNL